MFNWVLNTHLVSSIKYLYSSIIAEFWFIRKLWIYFVLIKESKFSNYFIINITTFYLVNILNNSCRISKIKNESLNLGPKLSYLGFKLTFQKKKLYLKQPRFFYNTKFWVKLNILKFKTKNPLFGYFWVGK